MYSIKQNQAHTVSLQVILIITTPYTGMGDAFLVITIHPMDYFDYTVCSR